MRNKSICRIVVMFVFFVLGVRCQAQSWSDMTSWFRNRGYELLAVYAHPTDDMVSHEIVSTSSSNIIVKIRFEGIIRYYTCKYEIIRGDYDGVTFFKTVKVLDEGSFPTSFDAWNMMPRAFSSIYSQMDDVMPKLYGERSFNDLSLGKQAAFALFVEFLSYYLD